MKHTFSGCIPEIQFAFKEIVMKYTISDIAQIAGVSKATVSRVLNNKDRGVGLETKKRVLHVIEELNYRPNTLARSVAMAHSMTVGLIVPDISNYFYNPIARAVDDILSPAGYAVILTNSDSDPEKEKRHLLSFIDKRVDGVILCSGVSNESFLQEYKKYNVPLVMLGRNFDKHLSDASIAGDNYTGAIDAVAHLLQKGHSQIAYIDGNPGMAGSMQRMEGYRQALGRHGIPLDKKLKFTGDFTIDCGYDSIESLLEANTPFTAVFTGGDLIAIGAIRAMQKHGITVPEQIEVIGFDGIAAAELFTPLLSTVAKPHYEMAQEAAKKLLALIRGEPVMMRHMLVQLTLLLRQTTR